MSPFMRWTLRTTGVGLLVVTWMLGFAGRFEAVFAGMGALVCLSIGESDMDAPSISEAAKSQTPVAPTDGGGAK